MAIQAAKQLEADSTGNTAAISKVCIELTKYLTELTWHWQQEVALACIVFCCGMWWECRGIARAISCYCTLLAHIIVTLATAQDDASYIRR